MNLEQLDQVHDLKTASLFKWCLRAPFIAEENYDEGLHEVLGQMGGILGVLFQRGDDLLDFDIRNKEGKAILGDLKSGYLNSVGAYLSRDFSEKQIEELTKCEDLDQVYVLLGGEEKFQKQVREFDQMNDQAIALYEHLNESLKDFLNPIEVGLLAELKPLAHLLYYRS